MERKPNIYRDENGVPHVEADSEEELYWGHGYVHAVDRGLQMLLMRILGRGQLSEFLDSSDASLSIDKFFRRMNWREDSQTAIDRMTPSIAKFCEAYCAGANTAFKEKTPWEFKLRGYRPAPWTVADTILISRMIGYLTLAQSQAEMERFLVEMIQAGVTRDQLEELFPGNLEGLDAELIKKVKLDERMVPSEIHWRSGLPRMMASNNWVIAGARTESGHAILANDPHLEVNRLPAVWSEVSLKMGDRYVIGASMPGLPGIIVGRTADVAWGATYTFMDAIDSWVEHCQSGKYKREDDWIPFRRRDEIIRRKRKAETRIAFYENEHGILDGDPNIEGYYLATQWTSAQSGALSIAQILKMWHVRNVREGMDTLGKIETSFNWVLADREGNIGYQMSGLMPKRREGVSGLVPLPGWKMENDWQGMVDHADLPRAYNPEQGYFVTANQDLNSYGNVRPINLPMGMYRTERISDLIEAKGKGIDTNDIFRMHYDVYSLHAREFMEILSPLLPATAQGGILKRWDFRYNADSKGAWLFEVFYQALFREVFGRRGLGVEVTDYLERESGLYADFYINSDRILLSERSVWFGAETRDTIYRRIAKDALSVEPKAWGSVQQVSLNHIFFGGKFGKLPRFLGFDRGPITIVGGRATIHQGQIYRSKGRLTTFVPSFRSVTDMGTDECHTNIAGGPSDRRFSRWYCSDLENWINGRYKTLSANPRGKKHPM